MFRFIVSCLVIRNKLIFKNDENFMVYGYSSTYKGKFSNLKFYLKKDEVGSNCNDESDDEFYD